MKKCINKRCGYELQDDFKFCPHCGKPQNQKKTRRRRAKGTGSVYERKDRKKNPFVACSETTGKRVYIGSFPTRTAATRALQEYEYNPVTNYNMTLTQLHNEWQAINYKKISKSTQDNYNAAWLKLRPLYNRKVHDLRTAEMQAIIDYYESSHHETGQDGKLKYIDKNGKGTYKITEKPKMCDGLKFSSLHKIKCLLTSMYDYAMQNDIVNKNYAKFIELPPKNETNRSRFTDIQLEKIRQSIGIVPYADYIYCMCYLNFRVAEFLDLTAESYKIVDDISIFVGGKKTDAGTDRIVPIHTNIKNIVKNCLAKNGETVFCGADGKSLNPEKFRKQCFYPAIKQMGLPDDLTPHSCRRTFSTRMSAAGARQEDIIALMGHTDFDVDIDHYINQETKTLYNAIMKMA